MIFLKKCIGESGASITEMLGDGYSLLAWTEGRRHSGISCLSDNNKNGRVSEIPGGGGSA